MLDSKNTIESINASYPSYIRCFASGQYLASLSYYFATLASLPPFAEILTQEGSFKAYYLKRLNLKEGLFAYLLLPVDKSRKEIKIVFRGTDFEDIKSALINLEPQGPGTASFESEKEGLFNTLKQVIKDYYENETDLTLEVCGHSQGAALSQLFAGEFVRRYNKDEDYDSITSLKMIALNSPGVPHQIADEANTAALLSWFMDRKLKISANYGMVGGDAVQVVGEDSVFATLPPYAAQVNLLKVDKGLEGRWLDAFTLHDGLQPIEFWNAAWNAFAAMLGAHSSVNYYAPLDIKGKINVYDRYDYFTNQNPKDHEKLQRELLNKAIFTQRLFYFPKMFLYYLIKLKKEDGSFSFSNMIRKMLGFDRIKTWYKKFTNWFNRVDEKNNTELKMPLQTLVSIDIPGEKAVCCCPQFLATKEAAISVNNPSCLAKEKTNWMPRTNRGI